VNLDPVRDALLADADRDANATRAAADDDAASTVAAARAAVERLLAAARADGEAEARVVSASELARAHRAAREVVLQARRAAYDRLRASVRDAASRLRATPEYEALIDGLTRVAREQLGEDPAVTVDDDVGGIVARVGSRTVDYRLPVVAERCLAAIGPAVETLWQ
jgi:vacuolar-type H+-ATPase subunit E/Vma4